ncbi:MAG: 2-C-methyl-D-erythritol 2,4-cyclodiphosphate synthase [Phycisphaerae bacterium]|nr:2-C-methyl-D-erythritol 2,4-cyclodiphosphate synthase [Phycisphaerae bacterium]
MQSFRTGIGYDLHRLASGRRLLLGGVEIPHDHGLIGHSDADVVLHAVCDALLGAAGLPDIGDLFPDSDPAWKDADSRQLTGRVLTRVSDAGFAPVNVDVIIHAEAPKLGPHKARIRASLASLLRLNEEAVGVKAKTNEGIGEIGTGQAIACWAAALIRRA